MTGTPYPLRMCRPCAGLGAIDRPKESWRMKLHSGERFERVRCESCGGSGCVSVYKSLPNAVPWLVNRILAMKAAL